jgi:hypothetical protein
VTQNQVMATSCWFESGREALMPLPREIGKHKYRAIPTCGVSGTKTGTCGGKTGHPTWRGWPKRMARHAKGMPGQDLRMEPLYHTEYKYPLARPLLICIRPGGVLERAGSCENSVVYALKIAQRFGTQLELDLVVPPPSAAQAEAANCGGLGRFRILHRCHPAMVAQDS